VSKPISTGNIRRYLTGCHCGRAFETDQPLTVVPDHVHNHELVTQGDVHTCTRCSWKVETRTPQHDPATGEAVRRAFAKHLLNTAIEEAA